MSNPKPLNIVLAVVDSEYPEKVNIGEIAKDKKLFKSAVRLAERNGLYYYFISRLRELNVDLPLLDVKRWEEENKKLEEFKESIKLLNKVSNDYGLDYIVIKECNTILHIPKDIDIFTQKEERSKIIKALEDNGMKYLDIDVNETILRKEGYIDVELYSRICYLGIDFIDGSFLRKSCVKNMMFEIEYFDLNKEANFLITLIHRLLGHRSMSLLDFLHMKHIRNDIQVDVCRKYACEKGWGSVFDLTLNKLNILHEKIYKEGDVVPFPYLFDRKFMLKCVSGIDGLNMGKYDKIIFSISLIQDRIIHELKDSFLYNLLKSFKPTRIVISFFTRSVRKMRGDMHR